jgi:hypothetical protein
MRNVAERKGHPLGCVLGGLTAIFCCQHFSAVQTGAMRRQTLPPRRMLAVLAAGLWLLVADTGWSGFVRGTVSAGGEPPTHSLRIAFYQKDPVTLTYNWVTEVETKASTGSYVAEGLDDGLYRVLALDPVGYYAMEVYNEAYIHSHACPVLTTTATVG